MTVADVSLEGKRVLMRVDFNVPMTSGIVTDAKRITAAPPTIQYVLDRGASLVLMSHLGAPEGTRFEPDFSLKAAAEELASNTHASDGSRASRGFREELERARLVAVSSPPLTMVAPVGRALPGVGALNDTR
jgi:3-phosphoglycerate kinase